MPLAPSAHAARKHPCRARIPGPAADRTAQRDCDPRETPAQHQKIRARRRRSARLRGAPAEDADQLRTLRDAARPVADGVRRRRLRRRRYRRRGSGAWRHVCSRSGSRSAATIGRSAGSSSRARSSSRRHQRSAWPSKPMRLAAVTAHHPHVEQHLAIGVAVAHANQRPGPPDRDAEFFARVRAPAPRGASSPGSSLPPGKLPAARQVLARRAAARSARDPAPSINTPATT